MNNNIAAVYWNTFITRTDIHSAGPNKKNLEAAKFSLNFWIKELHTSAIDEFFFNVIWIFFTFQSNVESK